MKPGLTRAMARTTATATNINNNSNNDDDDHNKKTTAAVATDGIDSRLNA